MYKVVLFYKYTNIDDPQALKISQKLLCQKLNLVGRVIIAGEGINATLEGTKEAINNYQLTMKKDQRFRDIHFKTSDGRGNAFPKLSVKVRDEIVAANLGKDDVDPNLVTGKYLTAQKLNQWIKEKRQFVIVDMRNDIEQQVGYFEASILSGIQYFKDLPKVLPKLKHLKDQTIVTVCTGGVRCEKASGFLIKNGFQDVYQLYGGIVTYLEKYPGQDFKGSLYVFDQRLVMGFNLADQNREIVGRCAKCQNPSENLINCLNGFCNKHFICCTNCLNGQEKILCPMGCRDYMRNPNF